MPRLLAVSAFVLLLLPGPAAAQPHAEASHFTDCLRQTGTNATVILPGDAAIEFSGAGLAVGDEVAVFSPDGVCSGVIVWNGQHRALTVWGAASSVADTDSATGLRPNEPMAFHVWDASDGVTYTPRTHQVTLEFRSDAAHLTADNRYVADGIYVIRTLRFTPVRADRE